MADYRLEQMYSHDLVLQRTRELVEEIYTDLRGFNLTEVVLTLGGMGIGVGIFNGLGDHPDLEPELMLESLGIRSRNGTHTIGKPQIYQPLKEPEISIRNRHVLLVDDIYHSGTTFNETAIPEIESYGPASLSVVTLLKARNLPPLRISGKEYFGFYINPDDYVIGEYLDIGSMRRGKKGIHRVIFEQAH